MDSDTKIAGAKTVQDWYDLRSRLNGAPNDASLWKEAFEFLHLRIGARYLRPLDRILEVDARAGEGFAAMVLLCTLVEFLEATFQGLIYSPPCSPENARKAAAKLEISQTAYEDHLQPFRYRSSAKLFEGFLAQRTPFSQYFSEKKLVARFYTDVRCGLVHELATRGDTVIKAEKQAAPDCIAEPRGKGLTVYRSAFHRGVDTVVQDFGHMLASDKKLQDNLARKMDDIAQIERCWYFAYGSNMLTRRLQERLAKVDALVHTWRAARLSGWRFAYDKRSKDGSSKANIARVDGKEVWGVCFEIDTSGLEELKRVEKGYQLEKLEVWLESRDEQPGRHIIAFTFASDLFTEAAPFENYVEIVVAGAREHNLPADYVELTLVPKGPESRQALARSAGPKGLNRRHSTPEGDHHG